MSNNVTDPRRDPQLQQKVATQMKTMEQTRQDFQKATQEKIRQRNQAAKTSTQPNTQMTGSPMPAKSQSRILTMSQDHLEELVNMVNSETELSITTQQLGDAMMQMDEQESQKVDQNCNNAPDTTQTASQASLDSNEAALMEDQKKEDEEMKEEINTVMKEHEQEKAVEKSAQPSSSQPSSSQKSSDENLLLMLLGEHDIQDYTKDNGIIVLTKDQIDRINRGQRDNFKRNKDEADKKKAEREDKKKDRLIKDVMRKNGLYEKHDTWLLYKERPMVKRNAFFDTNLLTDADKKKQTLGSKFKFDVDHSELAADLKTVNVSKYVSIYKDMSTLKTRYVYKLGSQVKYSNVESDLLLFLAKALELKIPPQRVEEELWRRSTICMYHAYGACIHCFDCDWSHEINMAGILSTYYWEFIKVTKRCENFKKTEAQHMGERWKKDLSDLFERHTKKRMYNYAKTVFWFKTNEKWSEYKILLQALRQTLLGHITQDQLIVKKACIEMQYFGKLHAGEAGEKDTLLASLKKESDLHQTTLKISYPMMMKAQYVQTALKKMDIFNATRLNTYRCCQEKGREKMEYVTASHGILHYDDISIFQTFQQGDQLMYPQITKEGVALEEIIKQICPKFDDAAVQRVVTWQKYYKFQDPVTKEILHEECAKKVKREVYEYENATKISEVELTEEILNLEKQLKFVNSTEKAENLQDINEVPCERQSFIGLSRDIDTFGYRARDWLMNEETVQMKAERIGLYLQMKKTTLRLMNDSKDLTLARIKLRKQKDEEYQVKYNSFVDKQKEYEKECGILREKIAKYKKYMPVENLEEEEVKQQWEIADKYDTLPDIIKIMIAKEGDLAGPFKEFMDWVDVKRIGMCDQTMIPYMLEYMLQYKIDTLDLGTHLAKREFCQNTKRDIVKIVVNAKHQTNPKFYSEVAHRGKLNRCLQKKAPLINYIHHEFQKAIKEEVEFTKEAKMNAVLNCPDFQSTIAIEAAKYKRQGNPLVVPLYVE